MEMKDFIKSALLMCIVTAITVCVVRGCVSAKIDKLEDGAENLVGEIIQDHDDYEAEHYNRAITDSEGKVFDGAPTEFSQGFREVIRETVFGPEEAYFVEKDVLLYHDENLVYHALFINHTGGYSAYDYLLSKELTEMFQKKQIPNLDNLDIDYKYAYNNECNYDYDGFIYLL